jgi:hypothetical protein
VAVDRPKVGLLTAAGLGVEAEWWVRSVDPLVGEPPGPDGFEAVVGPAPPVYDPGGPVCVARRVEKAAALESLERFAACSGAVLVIVPVEASRAALRGSLARRGYVVASEWYAASLSTGDLSG